MCKIQVKVLASIPISPIEHRLPFDTDYKYRFTQIGQVASRQQLIFVKETALITMREHTGGDTKHELGGMLLGQFYIDREVPYVWIEVAIPAYKANGRLAGLRFTTQAILDFDQEREVNYPDLRTIGWYHSHPGFGVFMSGTDIHTHRESFSSAPFVAIVLDPIQHDLGIFGWSGNEIVGPLGYWVVADKIE